MMDTHKLSTRARGQNAEIAVRHYLTKQGLRFIDQNYRSPFGEIDLIMQEGDCLVFIEVRSQHHANLIYASPIESVHGQKQRRIGKTALHYLQKHRLLDKVDCRFDICGVTAETIEWIKDAFTYE